MTCWMYFLSSVACPEVKRVLKSQVGGPNKEGRTSVRSVGNRGSPKTKETQARVSGKRRPPRKSAQLQFN